MPTLFTSGVTVITPNSITEYESRSTHGNKVHGLLGTAGIDAVLRPAGPRTGRLVAVIDDEAAAYAAETALRAAAVWTLTSDERPTIGMQFIVADAGSVTRELEPQTGASWLVGFEWQATE